MPDFAHVLGQFAANLTARGSQPTPRPLATMSTGMSFLSSIRQPTQDDVAVAGYIVAQFKLPDALELATDLGIPTDLIPARSGRAGDGMGMALVLGRGTAAQATVAAVALYSWFVSHAQAGRRSDADTLRGFAYAETLDGSSNRALAQSLLAAMDAVGNADVPPVPPFKYHYSISIDLCGSTDAKTRVLNNSQGNQAKIDHYNKLIYERFCWVEQRFFSGLMSRYGTGKPIPPLRLFTVKGIGDEMWTLCSATAEDVEDIGYRLIDVAIEVAKEVINLAVPENDDDHPWSPDHNYGHVEHIHSPIKIFIDLIEHATGIGTLRDEKLRDYVPDLWRDYRGLERMPGQEAPIPDEDIADVMRRLSLSTYEPIGRTVFTAIRTDFIGHEVDRFFRTTKAALPGTVSIGQTLARRLGLRFQPVSNDVQLGDGGAVNRLLWTIMSAVPSTAPMVRAIGRRFGLQLYPAEEGVSQVLLRNQQPLRGGLPNEPLYAIDRRLSKVELKGIGYDYETYTIFHPLLLKGNYVQMDAERTNGGAGTAFDDTIKRLPSNVVDWLAAKTVNDRAA